MGKFKTAIAFLLGAAAGGAGTWYFLEKRYVEQSDQDIASVKQAFHLREEKLKAEIDELRKCLEPIATGEPDSTPDKNTAEPIHNKYMKYVQPEAAVRTMVDGLDETAKRVSKKHHDKTVVESPYVISPDEFDELDGYTPVSLTYYADDILADENGVIIDNVEEIVGDALEHFGEYEDDSVFCRNDAKRCDYEILKDLRRYADVRKSLPHNL